MTRDKLCSKVSDKTLYPKQQVDDILGALTEVIADALQERENVTILGFGTFCPIKRKAKMGKDFRTGGTIPIPEKIIPGFRPHTALKEKVQEG